MELKRKLLKLFADLKGILKSNHLIVLGIKYIPLVSTLLLTLHVAFLLMGLYEPITVGLSAVLLVVLMVLLSIRFSFCWLHRAMIIYMAVMTLCICVQKYDGFGTLVTAVRLVLFAIGVGLAALAIFKKCDDECDR